MNGLNIRFFSLPVDLKLEMLFNTRSFVRFNLFTTIKDEVKAVISYSEEVLKTITSDSVPNHLALGIVNTFNIELALFVNPIGHGTSSEYLDSIIKHRSKRTGKG